MPAYERMRYWTTHNSYEGGPRGSIPAQLSRNVRSVELDVWDNDFERFGDYRLGHFKPGHAVALGSGAADENPKTLLLRDWLKTIAAWHQANDHAVLTVVLDLKSDLTDNEGAGDLEDLNARVEEAFGDSLFTRDDFDVTGAWPDTADLRNRVICVLSGNSNNRASYRFCTGERPALAMQDDGAVVVTYRSHAGDMRYWSGKARLPRGDGSGRIDWIHKGTYAWSPHTVSEPCVAAMGDGWFVSVYRIGPAPGKSSPSNLHCTIGELGDGGRVFWRDSHEVGPGVLPSLEVRRREQAPRRLHDAEREDPARPRGHPRPEEGPRGLGRSRGERRARLRARRVDLEGPRDPRPDEQRGPRAVRVRRRPARDRLPAAPVRRAAERGGPHGAARSGVLRRQRVQPRRDRARPGPGPGRASVVVQAERSRATAGTRAGELRRDRLPVRAVVRAVHAGRGAGGGLSGPDCDVDASAKLVDD